MVEPSPMQVMLDTLPQVGRVEWIGVRPVRDGPMNIVTQAQVCPETGLAGDRYDGRPGSKRQVTLIQHEHLAVIAGCLGDAGIDPEKLPGVLRRNVVVSGLNLLALKGKTFRVGSAVLRFTGLCHPCSKMEKALGAGGYNAVRGHGGITASVEAAGDFSIGSTVAMVSVFDETPALSPSPAPPPATPRSPPC